MRTVFIGVMFLATGLSFAKVPTAGMEELKREVKILTRIMEVVLEEDGLTNLWGKERLVHLSEVETLYLAGQGLMLRVQLEAMPMGNGILFTGNNNLNEEFFHAQFPSGRANGKQEAIEDLFRDAASRMQDINGLYSRHFSDKHISSMYQKAGEEFNEVKEALLAKRKDLLAQVEGADDTRLEAMLEEARQWTQKADDAAKKYRAGLDRVREESIRRWESKMKPLEDKLIQTLCEYGVLRNLPDGEHVTLVLAGAARSVEERRDKIFVFKKKDLEACRSGSKSFSDLANSAVQYSY